MLIFILEIRMVDKKTESKAISYFFYVFSEAFRRCLRQQPLNAVSLCVLTVASVKCLRFMSDILLDMLEVSDSCVYEKVYMWSLKYVSRYYQLTVN
jgi:hypothetical protein